MANLTLAQMLALLADNSSGQISATDLQTIVQALFERTDGTTAIPAIQFDTTASPTAVVGKVHWNSSVNTLDVEVATNGTLQVGHEAYMNARNNTGSTILNGRAVQITGGLGTAALISLDAGLGGIAGVATEDIANNATGRVTTFGVVNDLNTSAFNDGDRIYSTSTGTFTTNVTASFIGVVLNANPSIGRILVFPSSLAQTNGTTAARPTTRPTGFRYFDTTLGIPVWWNGSNWVNASGVTV
jgi:hypothetical protein